MLVPLTRQKLEQIIPVSATAEQYRYYWGKFPQFLQRLLISVISVVVIWVFDLVVGGYKFLALPLGITAGLYWLWSPVLQAGLRNAKFRKYPYAGFWRGEVLDVFVTEELIGKEETVNDRGDLVIVENRERRINLEIGDESGFTRDFQATLQREHQRIALGQVAELVVLSNQPDLERIAQITDIYIPSLKIWVSDYPYLKRDMFESVSRQLQPGARSRSQPGRRSRQDDYDRDDYDNYDDDSYDDRNDDLDGYDEDDTPPKRARQGSESGRRSPQDRSAEIDQFANDWSDAPPSRSSRKTKRSPQRSDRPAKRRNPNR